MLDTKNRKIGLSMKHFGEEKSPATVDKSTEEKPVVKKIVAPQTEKTPVSEPTEESAPVKKFEGRGLAGVVKKLSEEKLEDKAKRITEKLEKNPDKKDKVIEKEKKAPAKKPATKKAAEEKEAPVKKPAAKKTTKK